MLVYIHICGVKGITSSKELQINYKPEYNYKAKTGQNIASHKEKFNILRKKQCRRIIAYD